MGMKGDFLSFSFAGKDSSGLNIVRTSDGDRFDEQVIPEIKDVTVEVPGMDGEYFFGSTYGPRKFEISIAYDSLTESQFRELRQLYGRRRIGELILSERPYKRYLVKIESPIELSYICFDEPKKTIGAARDGVRVASRTPITQEVDGEEQVIGYTIEREQVTPYERSEGTERIYKGEGKLSFVAYYPFAKSCFKVLDTDKQKNSDWAVSSGILSKEKRDENQIDVYQTVDGAGAINVYNAGDVPTGFRLYVPAEAMQEGFTLSYTHPGALPGDIMPQLVIKPMELKKYAADSFDAGVIIDTNTGLITGIKPSTMSIAKMNVETGKVEEVTEVNEPLHIDYNGNVSYTTSGNLYNEYVDSGYFFKLQPDAYNTYSTLKITGGSDFQIFYDYLYF